MKKFLSASLLVFLASTFITGVASASTVYATGSQGVDVSYPNCSSKIPAVDFGIVGVTNGIVFGHNSCLQSEANKFSDLSLYINTGLNASNKSSYYVAAEAGCNGDAYCTAYHYGYNAAEDAISYAKTQNVSSTKWWLDVESANTWNKNVLLNQQSLEGAYDALIGNNATTVGVYSTTAQWQSVTGGWKNGWPSWGATTWTTAAQAQTYCAGHEFTNGPSLLMQYTPRKSPVDRDVAC